MYCRPEAYRLLLDQLPKLETTRGLLYSAVAVSMHELEDADPVWVERQIEALAEQIRGRVRTRDPKAILAHTHDVLFDELGFVGNDVDYYNPRNSYLPLVLKSRQGLPITLALLYKCVVERLGLAVRGLNAPGHFLAEVSLAGNGSAGDAWPGWIIDAFHGGRVLSREEVFRMLDDLAGRRVQRDDQLISPATNAQWLYRILQNLVVIFDRLNRRDSLAAMLEMQAALEGHL